MGKIILCLMLSLAVVSFAASLFAGLVGLFLSIGVIKIAANILAGCLTAGLFVGCYVAFLLAP